MKMLEFGDFRVDLQDEQLWRGDQSVKLRPKTWRVLRLLVEHSGRLLSTSQLLDAVWSDVDVSQGTLTQSIAELRRALGDDAGRPQFIQTVHRRGYRFIAAFRPSPTPEAAHGPGVLRLPPSPVLGKMERDDAWLPGREPELERLNLLMNEARAGKRQIVFVSGETGIGKTCLIRTFLQSLTHRKTEEPVWVTGGRCVEFVGEGETFLPVLEALEHLAQIVEPKLFRRILTSRAPTWLTQIPWLMESDEEQETRNPVEFATPKRMLQESCVGVEALTAEGTLVLWFEDLHWSDLATVDLIAALASRTNPCRLLLLATYRPGEAAMNSHPIAPLKRNLVQQQAAVELPLGLLNKTAVQSYLDRQFAPGFEPSLVDVIYDLTEGNPLFMVTLVNHLVDEELIVQTDEQSLWTLTFPLENLREPPPESVTALIELQLSRMDAETLSALEAGSVEGVTFGAQAAAAATGKDVEAVETTLGVLAGRGQFLKAVGAERYPDGSVGERFRFLHSAFSHVLYRRQTAARLQRAHLRVAERLEEGFQDQPDLPAAKLALHFEKGGDPERAVHYLVRAATGARERLGDRETLSYFNRTFDQIATLPDTDDRARLELDLRMKFARELNVSADFSSVQQGSSLARALELCNRIGDRRTLGYIQSYQARSQLTEAEFEAVWSLRDERLELAESLGDPVLLAATHNELGDAALQRADLEHARQEYERCLEATEGAEPSKLHAMHGHDPAVTALGLAGWAAWEQGLPDEAQRNAEACLARADFVRYPLDRTFAKMLALLVAVLRRDVDAATSLAGAYEDLVEEYGFTLPQPIIPAAIGWLLAQNGKTAAAAERMREGIAVSRSAGSLRFSSFILVTLAETELERGGVEEGFKALGEALTHVEKTGERLREAEIHRLRGELLRLDGGKERAGACFEQALEVARSQGARSLELRAATSLSRLWRDESREDEAQSLLASVYDGFTEGFDTLDLRDAKDLLDSL
jgi:DNA-binding winged helix-turn-helix (wHTH) protein/tetratricopeptide (TPR) repeat protein